MRALVAGGRRPALVHTFWPINDATIAVRGQHQLSALHPLQSAGVHSAPTARFFMVVAIVSAVCGVGYFMLSVPVQSGTVLWDSGQREQAIGILRAAVDESEPGADAKRDSCLRWRSARAATGQAPSPR